jgi:hypothetical protein
MSTQPGPTNDTQRELEQRALRNVRGLVDNLDSMERVDRRAQRKLFAMLVGGAIVGVVLLAGVVTYVATRPAGKAIVIEAPRK